MSMGKQRKENEDDDDDDDDDDADDDCQFLECSKPPSRIGVLRTQKLRTPLVGAVKG